MSEDVVPRDELRAVIEARKEVDEDLEPALVDAFVERIERGLEPSLERRQLLLELVGVVLRL